MESRKQNKKFITTYLENDCAFRDYRILPAKYYGKVHRVGMHLLEPQTWDLDDALSVFSRDGYPMIYIYI